MERKLRVHRKCKAFPSCGVNSRKQIQRLREKRQGVPYWQQKRRGQRRTEAPGSVPISAGRLKITTSYGDVGTSTLLCVEGP